ncbi:MAG: hypothetical protein H7Y28_13060 [Rhodoferax sp.]|nr:hypothetical protein [Rhodoferax sp.]
MGPLDLFNHLLNFVAPAVAVGCLLAFGSWIFIKKRPAALVLLAQAAINSVAGVAALALALWFFGRDGKMAAYAALVVVCASSQWLAMRR